MLLQSIQSYLANSAAPHVQVSPRMRLSGGTTTNVPASSASTAALFTQNLPVLGGPNTAYFFEYVGGSIAVNAIGLTITDLGLFFGTAGNIFLCAGQPVLTTLTPQALTGLIFQVPAPLVQYEDLFTEASEAALTPAEPFQLTLRLQVKNSVASIIAITPALNILVRVVRGLQEG